MASISQACARTVISMSTFIGCQQYCAKTFRLIFCIINSYLSTTDSQRCWVVPVSFCSPRQNTKHRLDFSDQKHKGNKGNVHDQKHPPAGSKASKVGLRETTTVYSHSQQGTDRYLNPVVSQLHAVTYNGWNNVTKTLRCRVHLKFPHISI